MGAASVWFDLTAGDAGKLGRVRRRSVRLVGWPGVGEYRAWITDGQPWAGITLAGALPAGRWVLSVVVNHLDTAAKQVGVLGGRVVRDRATGLAGMSVIGGSCRRLGRVVRPGRVTRLRRSGRDDPPAPAIRMHETDVRGSLRCR